MKKASLVKEFVLFAGIVVLSVVFLTVSYTWHTYNTESSHIVEQLENASTRAERSLDQSLKYSKYILEYILSQINEKWDDLHYIDNLLHTLRVDQEVNTVFSWNMFSWANEYHKVTVNSIRRILDKPADVSMMSNMAATMTEPGVMQLGNPTYGAVSGHLVIPASIGAVDEFGRYVGSIGIGFNIEGIVNKLERLIDNASINYALIDNNFQPVVQSIHERVSQQPAVIQLLKQHLAIREFSGMISYYYPWKTNSHYVYFQRIPDSPYILLISYSANMVQEKMWQQVSKELQQFAIIGIVILILLTLLYMRLIGPVTRLSITADKISRGEQDIIFPVNGHYEIANLADKLKQVMNYINEIKQVRNALAEQSNALYIAKEEAEKAHMQVQQVNANLEHRVAERTQLLQEALNMKEEFLNNMSHEIRTPIACIQLQSDMLVEDWQDLDEKMKKRLANDIQGSCIRLFKLLNNLLDLSKSRAGKMMYDVELGDLTTVIKMVVEECKPLYNTKHLSVKFVQKTKDTVMNFDAGRIAQVVRNLLANAIKFTPHGIITVTISEQEVTYDDGRQEPSIILSLADEGIGIPDNELNTIFESFTQSSKTKTGAGGTGLGLAICREIVMAHQGKIWAENGKEGKGAVFNVALPRR